MSNYTKTTSFGTKDTLPSGDSQKIIRGSEFDTEFDNIATAITSKLDSPASSSSVNFLQDSAYAVSRTVQSKLRDVVSVKDFGAVGDGVTDDTAAIQSAINYASGASGTVTASGTFRCASGLIIPSASRYNLNFTGSKLVFDPGVTAAVTVGTIGANPYRGSIINLWIEKAAYVGGDSGICLLNCVEANIENLVVINFSKAMNWSSAASSRAAYNTVINPSFQNHQYGIYAQPVSTSFANENTVIGGRFAANVSGRLIDHIYLDNTSGTGVQHNRFIGVSIEGWSGGGACGNSAITAVNSANQNLFYFCRCESYGTGWSSGSSVQFGVGTNGNFFQDSRIDTTINDASGENEWDTRLQGMRRVSHSTSGPAASPVFRAKRRQPVTVAADQYAIDVEDTFSTTGVPAFLKYSSPRQQSGAAKVIDIETGFGEIFVLTDNGNLLPRDNFAQLGSSTNRYQGIHTLGSIYKYATSPAQITSDQNAFNPSGTTGVWRINSDASRTINGIDGGVNGREILLINTGSNAIILANESTSAATADRIVTGSGANITLNQNNTVTLWYDSSSGRWRVIGAQI